MIQGRFPITNDRKPKHLLRAAPATGNAHDPVSSDETASRQADLRCLAEGFFAAVSFAGFLPAISISISFWPAAALRGFF
jgi:hypothetical protein